jgi:hypothetical protein
VGFRDVSIGRRNELFLLEGLDTPNQLEFVRQIKVYVKSNSRPAGGTREAIAAPDLPVVGQISGGAACGVGARKAEAAGVDHLRNPSLAARCAFEVICNKTRSQMTSKNAKALGRGSSLDAVQAEALDCATIVG